MDGSSLVSSSNSDRNKMSGSQRIFFIFFFAPDRCRVSLGRGGGCSRVCTVQPFPVFFFLNRPNKQKNRTSGNYSAAISYYNMDHHYQHHHVATDTTNEIMMNNLNGIIQLDHHHHHGPIPSYNSTYPQMHCTVAVVLQQHLLLLIILQWCTTSVPW